MAGGQPLIHARDLRKTYHVGDQVVHALDGLDLDIHANEYVALMGPVGFGKSTLMNMLGCLDSPTSGTYILNDQEVSRLEDDALADIRNREIGFVFQTFNLLPRYTALENVALPMVYAGMGKAERMARAEEVLHQVGLGDRMDHRPNELSGGQRQRVAVGRALVMKPSIILGGRADGQFGHRHVARGDGAVWGHPKGGKHGHSRDPRRGHRSIRPPDGSLARRPGGVGRLTREIPAFGAGKPGTLSLLCVSTLFTRAKPLT